MGEPTEIPSYPGLPILSGHTIARLLGAEPGPFGLSLDLGRSRCEVAVESERIVLPGRRAVPRNELAEAFSEPEDCVQLRPDGPWKVYIFDPEARSYYKLFQPVEDRPPTIVINGATMHAIVGRDPWEDEVAKVAAPLRAAPPRAGGECLDTCGGLGYSAQLLAEAGFERVLTCEVDRNVLEVAAANPWSEGMFCDEKIDLRRADLREVVAACAPERFACVFHDPPTVFQAGELYAGELYGGLRRVLAPGGVLYHYVGAPGARGGRDYAAGVIRRLQAAGFRKVGRVESGVLAVRPR